MAKLTAELETQKKELEEIAAKKLEEAEATFNKQLAEMQTLLADYQTQVKHTAVNTNLLCSWWLLAAVGCQQSGNTVLRCHQDVCFIADKGNDVPSV